MYVCGIGHQDSIEVRLEKRKDIFEGTRTALALTRLANDASASSAIALRQVERRSAPTPLLSLQKP
jgi:hypothetical protein